MVSSNTAAGAPSQLYRPRGGKLRPSQVITTFGPGAVVDLPAESVMVAGIESWSPGPIIHEPRLESALGLTCFRAPSMRKSGDDLRCVRFPRQMICSNCGLFSYNKKCPACQSESYPARLIVICPDGHVDEFPWQWWVHRKGRCKGSPRLRLINQKKTAALADLVVRCDTCEQFRSLSGALGPKALEDLTCKGKRPWLIGAPDEECTQKLRSVLRGASNVYFSSTISALSIPPWSSPLQTVLDEHWQTLRQLKEDIRRSVIQSLPDFAGFNVEDVMRAIRDRLNNTTTISSLRREEFLAFRNPGRGIAPSDFQIRREAAPDRYQSSIAQVVLAFRLREVCVLRGFTRIDPPDSDNSEQKLAAISQEPQNWLPAVEHRGEGIFIELALDKIREWERRPQVQERLNRLNIAYANWRQQRGLPSASPLTPRLALLHTLAHLLIRQLSLACGYSSSSLRERIYAGPDMCGLLIYTASADSDGSLGGLVQQGLKERFSTTMQALLESAQWCSSDPLCTEHDPRKTGKVNGASCHACSLVAETSCEYGNRFLDRALLCDLPGSSGTGFFE